VRGLFFAHFTRADMNSPTLIEQPDRLSSSSAAAASERRTGLMRARATDPLTSHEAADRVDEFAGAHQERVLQALRLLGFAGAEQIGELVGMPAYAVRKRLSELQRDGLADVTGETRKTASGRSERVWRAA